MNENSATGAALIMAERLRQVVSEGWTPEHDRQHDGEALVAAAVCYLTAPSESPLVRNAVLVSHGPTAGEPWAPSQWPWHARFWKPTPDDRIRELVKAGALIAAEIDRLAACGVSV